MPGVGTVDYYNTCYTVEGYGTQCAQLANTACDLSGDSAMIKFEETFETGQ